jgi:predicted dehydrogenase
MVAHCWRFDAEARWLRQRIVDGRLGRIVRTKGYGVHVNWGPKGWFNQAALAGSGALADMGIHALDTVRYLLGDPLAASVYAQVGTHYREMDVDDTAVLIVTWQGGITSYLESGWFQPQADGPEAATQLYGTDGFGRLFPTHLRRVSGEVEESGYKFPREPHCLPSMYETQLRAFLEAIRTGRVEQGGSAVSLENMYVLDATRESARIGEVVHL